MENTNKKVLYYGIAAVVVLALIIFLMMKKGGPALTGDVDQEIDQTTGLSTEDTSTGSVNGGQKAPYIAYDEALVKYKDTRIQINSGCQAFPNNVTYKNGTTIMIDNRSNVDHLVKVGTNLLESLMILKPKALTV